MERMQKLDITQLGHVLDGFKVIDVENVIAKSNANSQIISRAHLDSTLPSSGDSSVPAPGVTINVESVRSDEDIIALANLAEEERRRMVRR